MRAASKRCVAWLAICLIEIWIVSYLFYFPTDLHEWSNPVSYAKKLVHVVVLATVVFAIVAWPKRFVILNDWVRSGASHNWLPALLANFSIFTLLVGATIAFTGHVATTQEPPWAWFWVYCGLLLANAVSLALLAASPAFWARLLRLLPIEAALALSGAIFVLLAGELSRQSWRTLSSATLAVAAWLLSLYEPGVTVDASRQVLGAGGFRVLILPECSGYEGIGLVIAFMSLYFWVFRSELRFPNALLLLPVGIAAIWLLNAARIAALVSIGAHLSPSVAADGFHSQAGWIAFLLVTVGLMAISHRSSYFRVQPQLQRATPPASKVRLVYALLLPFIALMATTIIASAFAPHEQWLYGLKVVVVGAVLWRFRDVYLGFAANFSPLSTTVGLAIGVIWVATDPGAGQEVRLQTWLYALPSAAAAAWLAVRAFGAIVIVPLAEELAFRGYLHHALASWHFETAAPGRFPWLALLASSVLFGVLHQRWLAGTLAGAAYAILMYRTGKISDPIAAHMGSNAVIVVCAIAAGQWSLL